MTKRSPARQHHYMVTAQILFTVQGKDDLNVAMQNTLVLAPEQKITVTQIARAQQGVQMQLTQKMGTTEIEVRDVVITALMYLGHMTTEEFTKAPDNMELRQQIESAMMETEGNA